VHSIRKGDNY
jgi:hypothetical protein